MAARYPGRRLRASRLLARAGTGRPPLVPVARDERPRPDEPQRAGREHHQLRTQVRGLAEHERGPNKHGCPDHRRVEQPDASGQAVRGHADQVARTRIGSTFPNWPLPRNATPVPSQTAIQTTTDPIQ